MDNRTTAFERALQQAQEDPLDAFISVTEPTTVQSQPTSGELAGVPYAVKDNIDTAALPTSANTPALVGSRREHDHEIVTRLHNAGALLVGKTNLHELAFGITTGAAAHPATRNPFHPSRSPGGSSGGSGAAVGSGIVPFALATDTGGSVSIPAAWCGVYGYRPSIGRWPSDGRAAPLSKTRDAIGVIAESLELVRQVDAVVRDHHSDITPPSKFRVGVPRKDSTYLDPLADDVQERWDRTFQLLEATESIELVEVDTHKLHELDAACGISIVLYETARDLRAYLAALPEPVTFEQVRDQSGAGDVRELLTLAWEQRENHDAYREAMNLHEQLRDEWDRLFSEHDIAGLLRPTTPISPTPVGDDITTTAFGQEVPTFGTVIRNTGPGSLAGQPAVTIPVGIGTAGLPVGVTIDGNRDHDDALFALATELDTHIGVRSPLL